MDDYGFPVDSVESPDFVADRNAAIAASLANDGYGAHGPVPLGSAASTLVIRSKTRARARRRI